MEEKVRASLSKELESMIKETISSSQNGADVVSSDVVQGICNVIEAIFIHGLRDPFFLKGSRYAKYPEPNFWPFVSKFSHPSITSQIRSLSMINTEIGKSRAWIRIVLNEGSIEHYVKLLLGEKRAIEQFYNEHAYLRDAEQTDRMSDVVRSLSKIAIKTAVNSALLNTWTPSPLILAGLVSGKPQKVSASLRPSRQPRFQPSTSDSTTEVGLSALDTLPDQVLPPVVKRRLCAVERRGNPFDDSGSDTSSVYSHPSMTERRSLPFSPSPTIPIGSVNSVPADLPPLDLSPITVTRRTSTSESTRSRPSSVSESRDSLQKAEESAKETEQEEKKTELVEEHSELKKEENDETQREHEEVKEEKEEEASTNMELEQNEENEENMQEDSKVDDTEETEHAEQNENRETQEEQEIEEGHRTSTPIRIRDRDMKNSESRCNSTSSSASSPSFGVVSFGQALRSAYNECQTTTQADEEFTEATSSESEHANEEKAGEKREIEVLFRLCKLPKEKGLDAQEFRCPMCRKTIGINLAKYDICGMDSQYYCMECMQGGEGPIPSRVLLNWDWGCRKLSHRGRTFIDANQEKAVIDIQKVNPQLYKRIPVMANILRLREKLRLISMYLFTCRESVAEDFKKRIWPKNYLYEQEHIYAFADLVALHNGHLESNLTGLLKYAISHVMSCALCRQKGFYCELCRKKELLYPFQDNIHRCPDCCSVFHIECMKQVFDCPKCARKRAQRQNETTTQENREMSLPLDL
ncbi:hypothetical protein WR25_21406 [Diploscapter pachys]|uniref:RUN domain-containing protein n=1 Tax=Diploscapter pachys TaxID=2018661 RepID=A0A2A2JCD3_9BILA|nr:hypothetical protein WR25_21406 [Diploscapter pachys]